MGPIATPSNRRLSAVRLYFQCERQVDVRLRSHEGVLDWIPEMTG